MQKNKKVFAVIFFISASFLWVLSASAATLSLSPSFDNKNIGQTFTVSVLVNAQNQAINALSGTIAFPTDKLEVVGISKAGTIINVWISEPTFSNQAGEINFEGIALNPGFSGSAGKIITISFRSKDIGLAKTFFSAGSVLANDGTGTNVLTEMLGSEFNILKSETQGITGGSFTTPSIAADSPQAPEITSPTHPNPEAWYQNNTAKFLWNIDEKITAVRTLLNKQANSSPTILNEKPITEKEVSNLDNGTWYFHLQVKNSKGWGSISHFRINIDNTAPNAFEIEQLKNTDPTDPQPTFSFKTTDQSSGINKYRIKIDDQEFIDAPEKTTETGIFEIPKQKPGKHSLVIQAIDKAGNKTTAFQEFTITPINSPELINYPEQIQEGELIYLEGRTYPNSSVYISLAAQNENPESKIVRSSPDGSFSFVWPEMLSSGKYSLFAQAVNDNGAMSNNSKERVIKVSAGVIIQIGRLKITNPYIGWGLLILIMFASLSGIYGWYSNIRHKHPDKKFFKSKKPRKE